MYKTVIIESCHILRQLSKQIVKGSLLCSVEEASILASIHMHLNEMKDDDTVLPTVIITCDEDKGGNLPSRLTSISNSSHSNENSFNSPKRFMRHKLTQHDQLNKNTVLDRNLIKKLKASAAMSKRLVGKRRRQSKYLNPIQMHYNFSKARYVRRRVVGFFSNLRSSFSSTFSKTACIENLSCKRCTVSKLKNGLVCAFLSLKKKICLVEKPIFDECLPPHFKGKKSVYKMVEVV